MVYLALFITALILRLPFLSPWLEDWDSVQFAMALNNYDLSQNLPHAPGYPLYILVGKFLMQFTQNETLALTLLSAICGSLSVILIFMIAKRMFDQKTAIFSAIIFAVAPVTWLLSVSALTNIPGLMALLFFIYILLKMGGEYPLTVAFLAGFILGVRATELPIIVSLLIFSHITQIRNIKRTILSAMFFFAGAVAWLLPMIAVTGLGSFWKAYRWIASYIIFHDSLANISTSLIERLTKINHLLNLGVTPFFLAAAGISLIIILKQKGIWGNQKILFLTTWLLSYLIPLVFIYNLEVTRYILPLVPPLAILISSTALSFKKPIQKISLSALVIVLIAMFYQGLSQVSQFKNYIPPTIAPVLFVKENFLPEKTLVLASYTFRQFQYYAPEFNILYNQNLTENDTKGKEFIIIDSPTLLAKIPANISPKVINESEFTGNPEVYTRINKTILTVIKISKQ